MKKGREGTQRRGASIGEKLRTGGGAAEEKG